MELFLDSKNGAYEDFLLKVKHFRKYKGMYITDDKFESVAAFIGGMDFFQSNDLLNEFRVWLLNKYQVESAFGWSYLIRMIYIEAYADQDDYDIDLNDFLLDNLEDFLSS